MGYDTIGDGTGCDTIQGNTTGVLPGNTNTRLFSPQAINPMAWYWDPTLVFGLQALEGGDHVTTGWEGTSLALGKYYLA